MEALRAHFKPEFLNRVDDVIIYHQLSRDHIGRIVGPSSSNACGSSWRSEATRARSSATRPGSSWPSGAIDAALRCATAQARDPAHGPGGRSPEDPRSWPTPASRAKPSSSVCADPGSPIPRRAAAGFPRGGDLRIDHTPGAEKQSLTCGPFQNRTSDR